MTATKGRSLTMLKRSTIITAAQDLAFVLETRGWTVDQVAQKVLDGTVENPVIRDLLLSREDVRPIDKAQIRSKFTDVVEPLTIHTVLVTPVNPALKVLPVQVGLEETARREGVRGGRYVLLTLSDGRIAEATAVQIVRLNAGIRIRVLLVNPAEGGTKRQFYFNPV